MPVRADGANRGPPIVELVGKKKRGRVSSLIDLFIRRRKGAAEKNFVGCRPWNGPPGDHPLLSARCLIATRECGGGSRSIGERSDDGCVEPGYVRDVTKVHVCEIVGRQMLALVVLEPLRETKPRIAKTHIRAVVSSARDAIEPEHGENLERRVVNRSRRPGVARELPARTVLRLRAENSGAGRVHLAIVSDYVAHDVVGESRNDLVACRVQSLREVRRAV